VSLSLLAPSSAAPIAVPQARIAMPATRLDQVEAQVTELEMQAAMSAEDWNAARIELAEVNARISVLKRKTANQQEAYRALSRDLGGLVRSMYKTGGVDLDIQAMIDSDPAGFLARLDAISLVGSRQQASLRKILVANLNLKQSTAELRVEQKQAAKITERANAHRRTAERKLQEAQTLLNSLQAADRRKREARIAAQKREQAKKAQQAKKKVTTAVSNNRLRRVLSYALAQVGDDYNMGSTGPNAYDCSGLTMMAYRQIGVNLSHFSLAQWSQTRRVSRSQLAPGDLVFFFNGIRHVGMYIGNNNFVHAASYGTGVTVSSLSERYYVQRLSGYGRVLR
jgi:cell wall-associated NlpC family hydrolase